MCLPRGLGFRAVPLHTQPPCAPRITWQARRQPLCARIPPMMAMPGTFTTIQSTLLWLHGSACHLAWCGGLPLPDFPVAALPHALPAACATVQLGFQCATKAYCTVHPPAPRFCKASSSTSPAGLRRRWGRPMVLAHPCWPASKEA